MAEADRHMEEQAEIERKQAEEMAAARAARAVEFNKEYRNCLDIQRAETEAQKLVDLEKREAEMAIRRQLEQELADQVPRVPLLFSLPVSHFRYFFRKRRRPNRRR